MESGVKMSDRGMVCLSRKDYLKYQKIIVAIAREMATPGHPFLDEDDLVSEGWCVLLKVRTSPYQLSKAMRNRVVDLRRRHLLAKKRGVDQNGDTWQLQVVEEAASRAEWPDARVTLAEAVERVSRDLRLGGEQEVFRLAVQNQTGDTEWLAEQTGLSRPWVQGLKRSIREKLTQALR